MVSRLYRLVFENFATKLVSILVAAVLWIVVLSSKTVDMSKDVSFEVLTSPDVVVANELPDRVSFQIAGPKAFRRAVIERTETPLRVNLIGAKPGTLSYNFSADDLHLPPGMRVSSIAPSSIRIRLEPVRYSKVKVRADVKGEPEKGFRIVKTEVQPQEVQIKGPKGQLSALTELVSNPVSVAGISKSMQQPLTFELAHLGVAIDGPTPVLNVEVEASSPNYRLRNVGIHVLTAHRFSLNEQAVTVFVRASPEDLRTLDHSRVFAEIDLRGQKKGKYTVGVRVSAPKAIGVLRVIPEKVEVTLY